MEVQVNWLAVLLAAMSSMVVGSAWYARGVFGASWMKLTGLGEKDVQTGAGKAMAKAFVASLLMAYVIAHVSYLSNAFFKSTFLGDSLNTAFWLWLGVSTTTVVIHDAFEKRATKLTLITIGYQLAAMLAMGLIIGLMGPS